MITKHLGKRPAQAQYSYNDVIKNLWAIIFAGGDCAEDIHTNLKEELQQIQNLNICSPDTILGVQKQLAGEKEIHLSLSKIVNEFSKHSTLNALNLEFLVKNKVLDINQLHDFYFDNQFIPTEKFDSKKGYKMNEGYFPGVASIGRHIVYIENRNGNCNVKYKQAETLEAAFKLLKGENIKINRGRMDCGSFSKDITKVVEANCKSFYIRALRCDDLASQIREVSKWETVKVGVLNVEVCSIGYAPFGEEKKYRHVVQRERNKTGQTDAFYNDNFVYRAIATNDWVSTGQEVIAYYNQREAGEKIFDEMNNDFGWKNSPFSFLKENTV